MKSFLNKSVLALVLGSLLLVNSVSAQEKKTRPEPPGPDPQPIKKAETTADSQKKPAEKAAEGKTEKKPAPKKTGNWYIRQSPQLLQALEPVSKSSLGSTVKVLGNVKKRNKKIEEGQVAFGTVIDAAGFIVTKASQIQSRAKELKIEINGKKVPAKIFGIHEQSDLAMLKVEPAGLELKSIQWQNQTPEVGYLLATPNSVGKTLGFGVLSVGSREERSTRGYMGVNLENVSEKEKGSMIIRVAPKSPAAYAGLRVGDLILRVNDKEVKNTQDLISKVGKHQAGETVKIKFRRDDKEIEKSVKLGDRAALGLTRLNPQETIAGNKLSSRRTGFERVIQHDTVLKPEDMGGPILDLDGRALGLNIAKNGRVSTYALPLSVILPAISDLRSGKLAPEIVNKPRIDQINALIAEKEKQIADSKLKEKASEAQKKLDEAKKAFEEAEKEYARAQKALEDAGKKKYRADEKHKEFHSENRKASKELEGAEKEIDELKKEKQELENAFK